LVEVTLSDNIQLTTHFSMNINDFFTNNVLSSFISNLCALIGITDTSRVKVVGVVSASVVVQTIILSSGSNSTANATNGSSGGASLAQIQQNIQQNGATIGNSLAAAINTTSLSISSVMNTIDTSSSSSGPSNLGLIIGVSIAGVVLLVVMVMTFFYCLRKRAKIVEEIRQSEEEMHHEKENYIIGESSNFDPQHASHVSEFKINQNTESNPKQHGLDE
jgi:predicted PurR-regulated permease PerM